MFWKKKENKWIECRPCFVLKVRIQLSLVSTYNLLINLRLSFLVSTGSIPDSIGYFSRSRPRVLIPSGVWDSGLDSAPNWLFSRAISTPSHRADTT
jgi:hypothetical protein